MNKIDTNSIVDGGQETSLERGLIGARNTGKKIQKSFLNYAGMLVGVLLLGVVIIVMTTEIHLTTFADFARIGMEFFVLAFCSYTMYLNLADSGMRFGLRASTYVSTVDNYDSLKDEIISSKTQGLMNDFCQEYITTELINIRTLILSEVGISYETYKRYIGKDKEDILKEEGLSKNQKKAIIKANRTKPILLTPEMILQRGRNSKRRNPLGVSPQTKKNIDYTIKAVRTFVVSALMSVIVFEAVTEPTRTVIASVCLKLISVIVNGFLGYKFGYENIVFDTSNYISNQSDLLSQFIEYTKKITEKNLPENGEIF